MARPGRRLPIWKQAKQTRLGCQIRNPRRLTPRKANRARETRISQTGVFSVAQHLALPVETGGHNALASRFEHSLLRHFALTRPNSWRQPRRAHQEVALGPFQFLAGVVADFAATRVKVDALDDKDGGDGAETPNLGMLMRERGGSIPTIPPSPGWMTG